MPAFNAFAFEKCRAEGESIGDGDEENRLLAGSGGEEWANGAKDRQQTTFSQPEQSYEAAFNKVRVASSASFLQQTASSFVGALSHSYRAHPRSRPPSFQMGAADQMCGVPANG